MRGKFCLRVRPGRLYREIPPFVAHVQAALHIPVVEWNPIGYTVCTSARKFGFVPFQTRARRKFVARIALRHGIPLWATAIDSAIACGVGRTEFDLHDFAFYAPTGGFSIWVLNLPIFTATPEDNEKMWSSILLVGGATIGDAMGRHFAVFDTWRFRLSGIKTV